MGKVHVSVRLENLADLYSASRGHLEAEKIHSVVIPDALVDTGATGFSAPRSIIDRLGLKPTRTRPIRTAAGPAVTQMFEAVQMTIEGRECIMDVTEVPSDCPVLIGQIPLELLDFVVDPVHHRLIGNPDHGGEHIMEMY